MAAVVAVAGLGGLPSTASADGSSTGSLSDQASALVARIDSENLLSDQLAEQVDQAQIQVAQIASRLQAAQKAVAATDLQVDQTTSVLSQQLVAAYMQDGRPLTYEAHDTANDPALITGYASSVAGVQQSTIDSYRQTRRDQATQVMALQSAEDAASASVQQLQAAQGSARAQAAQAEATLAQVQSQATLAAAVSSEQASQAATTEQTVSARFGVSETGAPLTRTAAVPAATAPATTSEPTTGAPTTGAPATYGSPAPVLTAPSTTVAAAPTTVRAPSTTGRVPGAPFGNTVPTLPPTTRAVPVATVPPTTAPPAPARGVLGGAGTAISFAQAQLGKPYLWGGAGPSSYDCSGLVMDAWGAAGVSFPHSAQSQYDETERVAVNALQPGDLVFFGTPGDVYHVGIYVGGGEMIDAPHTGADVRTESIYWGDLLGGGRVT